MRMDGQLSTARRQKDTIQLCGCFWIKTQTCPLQDRDGDMALLTAAFSGMKSTVELPLREADANATSMRLQFERCE
jgi:hypothetical protein